jgi:hypothetical protein
VAYLVRLLAEQEFATAAGEVTFGTRHSLPNDGTSDFLVHQDAGTTRTDIVYNVVNNVAVSTQTIAVTGIDWHVA